MAPNAKLILFSRGDAETQGRSEMVDVNAITGAVVNSALRIHMKLGPGLLESVYETVLAHDLERKGYLVERQKWISFDFEGVWFYDAFRADIIIEKAVVVEIKAAKNLAEVHERQLVTYLRLLDYRVGLLLNFGCPLMKDGISRFVNRL